MQDLKYISEQAKTERLVKEKARKEAENNASINENTGIVTNETTVPNQPIKPVYDENTPYVTPAPVAVQPVVAPITAPIAEPLSRADQLMQQFYATREQAPVHDQAKEDRLKKMGKINMIGRGIGVLGDVLTMGLGGNVRRSQPDRVQPMLYQQYQALMDKEKADQDSYKFRSFQNEREMLRVGIGEEHRKDSNKIASDNLKAANAYRDAKDKESQRRFDAGEITKAEQAKLTAQYRKDMIKARGGAGNKADKSIKIRTDSKEYELSPSEYSYTKGRALKNLDLLKKKFPTWVVTVPEVDIDGDPIPGKFTTRLDSRVKDDDLVREQKILEEEQENVNVLSKKHGTSVASKSMIQTKVKPQYSTNGLY